MVRVALIAITSLIAASGLHAEENGELLFERDVRSVFRAHCFDCHGATDDFQGGLDLRRVMTMQSGGHSGPALAAGDPSQSYLLDRMRNGEMPPGQHYVPESEIQIVEQWIAQGAKTVRPEPESIGPGLGITPEERSFWSFQPISRPDVRSLDSFPPADRVRTPIDALLMQSMPTGVSFSPDADRARLIRRAYFDLVGLPPSPEEMMTWSNDSADDWYDRLLTDLLDSPHYGERWGRHWLDVAGYADSEGYTNSDTERPWAWKYRDWVIRSLNEGKPFDQFLTEQLAGDELAGPRAGDLTAQQIELLTATGFLRMAADGTGSGTDNADSRNQVMTDTLKIVGTSLLGLSVQCAQCHDHRYDPILQTDYYALRAVFEPALDWQAWQQPNSRRVSLYTQADRERAAEIEAETKSVADEKAVRLAEYMKQALDAELMKFDEPLRGQLREAYETAADKRSDGHKQLLTSHPSVNITPGVLYQYIPDSKPQLEKYDQQIAAIRARKKPEEFLRALVEPPGHFPETKLFFRGDHSQPKQTVLPAALVVASPDGRYQPFAVDDEALPTTGRRTAFAGWLTSRDNPLTARVIVNRVWMHHFGKGLVETPSDFGKLGVAPSHPELLDWLADEFISSGWDLKRLHRLIMSSTVWRQSAEVEGQASNAPDSVPFVRKALIRLDAETLRDRMLVASGQLDRTQFGVPVAIKEDDTGQVIVDGAQTRRSLYIQWRRSRPVAMLQAFDAPVMETNCEVRAHSTVATQSLILMNGEFILEQAEKLAQRVANEAVPISSQQLAALPVLPPAAGSDWQYGYGDFEDASNRTVHFATLSHFDGSRWQAGPALPDPALGYVFLNATGGHPDQVGRAVIRRWTASASGIINIAGQLSHGSPNGDGVRGRIVSSRHGKVGEWSAFHGGTDTTAEAIAVEPGDTIDFVTDCKEHHTSDSFNWTVTIKLSCVGRVDRTIVSAEAFRGPADSPDSIPGQIVRAWQLTVCREPTSEELLLAMEFVARQVATFQEPERRLPDNRTPYHQAMVSLSQSLLSCNEFLYID